MKIPRLPERRIQKVYIGARSKWEINSPKGVFFTKKVDKHIHYIETHGKFKSLLREDNQYEKLIPIVE